MNKAITDGVVFMPTPFANGLDVWSSGDGTPGSDTYENAANAAFVPADQDFGGCLELQKVDAVQKLRYMSQTPLLPGCYLQIRARVKAVSGNLPELRIAGWAGDTGGNHVPGLIETGPTVTLAQYGNVVEVSAIVGVGQRGGVDMVWGAAASYGHFGLDLTGQSGGVIRIDDIEIEDVTKFYLRDIMAVVDVKDYGAIGDGTTDCLAAFEAADADAQGREVLVSAGNFFLGDSMTFNSRVRFEGTLTMPTAAILSLAKNFDLPAYIDAFGNEETAFKKAFQALLNGAGHESLDLGGRRIDVTTPIDLQAAVPNRTAYAVRRVIRNGQFEAKGDAPWDTETFTSQATYSASDGRKLSGVVNVANIPVGSLVTGTGVGREVYVREKNEATQEITLNKELYDAEGTQVFTFTRFKYVLDFSGFDRLDKFAITDVDINCTSRASGILLPPSGVAFQLRDSYVTSPKDRAITSHGEGCQGMFVERCQFLSTEAGTAAQDRASIVLNTAGNDIKLRNNRASYFRHFAVIGGSGSLISGNHIFQGDGTGLGLRSAGIVFTGTNTRAIVSGNYIDNCHLEWTNEHDNAPDFSSELSFSQLNITDNVFLCGDTVPWFSFIVVKPYGTGHYINHLVVEGNLFRTIGGNIDRVERVDTSFADLDYDKISNITFANNMFKLIGTTTESPLSLTHSEASDAQVWTVDGAPRLPFGAWAQSVEAVQPVGAIRNAAGAAHHGMPYVNVKKGANRDQIEIVWSEPVHGQVRAKIRID